MKPDAMSQYEEEEPALESHKEQLEEWEEDRCVICGSKCHIVRRSDSDGSSKSDGQFPADELLTLMDTVLDEPPENVTLCVACSFRVGRLQTFQEELARLQLSVTELQREIASSIVVTDGKNDENDVRASLCKRWRDIEPVGSVNNDNENSNESEEFRLVDIQSKIPKDLIISPAVNELMNEGEMEGEDEGDEDDDDEQNEVQFHLDPRLFEVVEESDMKGENSEGNRGAECIEVDDSDEEAEVDAASLIPAIEISAFESEPLEIREVTPVITQPNIYYSTNGRVFTSDLDSLFPPDSPGQQGGAGTMYAEQSQENNVASRRVIRSRSRTSNGVGKSNAPEFKCTVCPETFRTREKFKEHLETHGGKAPTCRICQKVFPRKHNLIIHMRTHTGEKPYDCPVCHKPYSDRSNFNAHVRKHMNKPFGCTICNRMFDSSSAAHAHATSQHPEKAAGKIISKVTFKSRNQ